MKLTHREIKNWINILNIKNDEKVKVVFDFLTKKFSIKVISLKEIPLRVKFLQKEYGPLVDIEIFPLDTKRKSVKIDYYALEAFRCLPKSCGKALRCLSKNITSTFQKEIFMEMVEKTIKYCKLFSASSVEIFFCLLGLKNDCLQSYIEEMYLKEISKEIVEEMKEW